VRSLFLVMVAAGCGTTPDNIFAVPDPTDNDEDGIADQLEDRLMEAFGPELRLPPDDKDWTRPANVDWFLPKVKMRFDHPNCPDDGDNLIDREDITFANLHGKTHHTKSTLCSHNDGADDLRDSSKKHLEFFLQAEDDDDVHPGIPPARSSEWRAYIQVRPSSYPGATHDLQVWYFFPYNDNIGGANHEADWEHMTISLSDEPAVVSVFYATHDAGHRIDDLAQLQWVDTHVVGYVADGSHATYERAGDHPGPVVADHAYEGGPVWQTWTNFKNLGQVGKVLNGQDWVRYGGRWGEVGSASFTSGPPGPMFNSKWDTAKEY
jgi:hypothetical protein